jgi:hypothetical protein
MQKLSSYMTSVITLILDSPLANSLIGILSDFTK